MKPINAVMVSVWAGASHAGDRFIYRNSMGFDLEIPPHMKPLVSLGEQELTEALQALGIDDEQWEPDGPEGLYEEICFSDEEAS